MATVQELQAAIVDVAVAARVRAQSRRVSSLQVTGHGVDEAMCAMLDDPAIYEEVLREEMTARDRGLTLQRSVDILKSALQDIRVAA